MEDEEAIETKDEDEDAAGNDVENRPYILELIKCGIGCDQDDAQMMRKMRKKKRKVKKMIMLKMVIKKRKRLQM